VGEGDQAALHKEELPPPVLGPARDRQVRGCLENKVSPLEETCENTVKKSLVLEEGELKRFSVVSG